ncbi:MAG: hypothetical protein JO326_03735, partial [Acetobacteraceae bacterium]|nr:hypothetical protein [Acetobacteraceae bacterium]
MLKRLRFRPVVIPVAIGAAVLVVCWAYLSWNTTVGVAFPHLRFRTKNTIAGIMEQGGPMLSSHAVLTGEVQQWISRSVGILSPMFKPAINWKNQIYYSLLGMSGIDEVIVGRNGQLIQYDWAQEYCTRDVAKLRRDGEAWAARIRTMQDFFDARGQAFLYVITPSKVAQHPETIPAGFPCPAPSEDKARKLEVYDAI